MNANDLRVALSFLDVYKKETVVLQCYKVKDIPYVKRLLKHELGDPSAMLETNVWRYGNKTFRIEPVSNESKLKGFEGEVYYISYEDESDWREVRAQAFATHDCIDLAPYMMTDTFGLGDVYTMLVRDGRTGDHALGVISNLDIMTV